MKGFIQRMGRINCYSNIFVSLLCTSYLFTGYGIYYVDNDIHHDTTAKVIENDMEVVSQSGKKGKIINLSSNTTKVTAVVTRQEVKTSNKNYTPAKYNEVTGSAIVSYAKKYLGLRYVSGGYSLETGTDCSGFTKLIYKEFGINLSRAVKSQVNYGSYIKKSDLQKGDLVFYGYGDGKVRHVAIYIGNGQVIHESNRTDGVKISSVNMMQYITARRLINDTANKIALDKTNALEKDTETKVESSNTQTEDKVSTSETKNNESNTSNTVDTSKNESTTNNTNNNVTSTPSKDGLESTNTSTNDTSNNTVSKNEEQNKETDKTLTESESNNTNTSNNETEKQETEQETNKETTNNVVVENKNNEVKDIDNSSSTTNTNNLDTPKDTYTTSEY